MLKIYFGVPRFVRNIPVTLLAAAGLSLSLAGMIGCGAGNPFPVGSYERGQHFVEKENYVEAVAALESFVRHNPTDSLAAEAQFLKAMTTMKMDEFPLAAVEFQILRKDYPTSNRVEEANFREGIAYFRQVGRIERDISGALGARRHFQDFLVKYPQSSFRPEAEGFLLDISDLVVLKRLRQCKVFRQLRRFGAIELTMDLVLTQEPGSRLIDRVLFERAKVAGKLEDAETQVTMYRRLVQEYPDSPLAEKARSELEGISIPDPQVESESGPSAKPDPAPESDQ
ncbi:MAG: outer membrane protein assembly factor BamD [Gemmatimonadales bacterium]|nr:outer membrane protein assembly factor BamD [Gemmatimonadales bacterium]